MGSSGLGRTRGGAGGGGATSRSIATELREPASPWGAHREPSRLPAHEQPAPGRRHSLTWTHVPDTAIPESEHVYYEVCVRAALKLSELTPH